ncbi:ATP-binding protein, partial [Staphylococcus pasteuri]|uniref:ATP-binding protein n=1 Tax=Staphylococcus pasteuri TaxID=45972 RepID=UPI000D381B6F
FTLLEEITYLISLKYEGSYWDFKQEHHSTEKNHKLLHDIICLANNLENRESYLIIGVADNGDIVGVDDKNFRRNQQQLIDLVRNKKWEGYGAPNIRIETLLINNVEIDVIVIAKSAHVPFTLAEDIKPKGQNNIYLKKHTIYTRNQDSNTPYNSAAKISEVESLMKYRLGLLPNPIERVKRYIEDKNNWNLIDSKNDSMSWYYLLQPEFKIEILMDEEKLRSPNFVFIYNKNRSSLLRVNIKFHSTILYWSYAWYVDEARGIVLHPDIGSLNIAEIGSKFTNSFDYYYSDSIKIQLSMFLMSLLNLDSTGYLWEKHLSYIPVFTNEEEKIKIVHLINRKSEEAKENIEKLKKEVLISKDNIGDEVYKFIKQDLATNLMIIEKIKQFRS